jgi:hypothetical protein
MNDAHARFMFHFGWICGTVFGLAGGVALGYHIWG